jgi:hypothetical protein
MYQNNWEHYITFVSNILQMEKKSQMGLFLCNVIFNILIYILNFLKIDLMNKKTKKDFQNICNHCFYNIKGFILNYFWQIW